jgi:hypothetical protein
LNVLLPERLFKVQTGGYRCHLKGFYHGAHREHRDFYDFLWALCVLCGEWLLII